MPENIPDARNAGKQPSEHRFHARNPKIDFSAGWRGGEPAQILACALELALASGALLRFSGTDVRYVALGALRTADCSVSPGRLGIYCLYRCIIRQTEAWVSACSGSVGWVLLLSD